jgi:HlyD family secretion protein
MNHAGRRKWWITGMILTVLLAVGYGFLPGTQQVDLVAVARGPLQVTIEEEGRTRLKERFVISAPTAGTLRRLNKKTGDPVRRGETVAVIEPLRSQALDPRSRAAAAAAVSAAEAALRSAVEKERAAEADADYSDKRAQRMNNLYSRGAVAKDQSDQTESEAKKARAVQLSAQAAVAGARSELERARTALDNYASVRQSAESHDLDVTSPVGGAVFRIHRESEGVVQAGEPLLDVGDAANIEVRVEVLSADAVRIRPAMAVLFKRWGRDEPLTGRVRRVEQAGFTKVSSLGVEEQRVLVIVDLTSPSDLWHALGDGYRLEAHFILWEGKDILQVPTSALFRSGQDWTVFVEENGRARRRTVAVGQRTGLAAELLSGLRENERVVAYPDDAVSDGTRIRSR